MKIQKDEVLSYVADERRKGRRVSEILRGLKVPSSNYYRWRKQAIESPRPVRSHTVTPKEKELIVKIKEEFPHLRHRQLQGLLQDRGQFVSASVVYQELKLHGLIEPYERRRAPWKEPFYEICRANVMWGADWSQMRINGRRWYLLTLIDFFSRLIVHHEIVMNVNAGHIKALYRDGLLNQGIPFDWHLKPELRMDQGSPNTSRVTKEFFKEIGANFSYASVRRPTENAITERFYRTVKQEEIYLVGDYQDEMTAREEIGKYIDWYNEKRPHQSLWNFTPGMVHEVNNKTELLLMLKALKKKVWTERKEYWKKMKKTLTVSRLLTR